MTKISLDTEQGEIQVTRSIGKSGDGKITVNREGGAIEINLGVGSVGVTTDYGGGISLGVAGQEVTWGREGGTIHLEVGGFEVDVEARDCIVTEIKSIFGQIVAQRSYPDPGCKPPDPPVPTPTPILEPDPIKGVEIPMTEQFLWVPMVSRTTYYDARGNIASWRESRPTISEKEREKVINSTNLPFKMTTTEWTSFSDQGSFAEITNKWAVVPKATFLTNVRPDYRFETSDGVRVIYFRTSRNSFIGGFIDTGVNINVFLKRIEDNNKEYLSNPSVHLHGNAYVNTYKPIDYVVVGEQRPPAPFLPTGNKPPMQNCCEEILDYLADFEEAFDIQRLLKDKFPVSNTFMAPECDPTSVTQAKSYYEIMQCSFRMMAHGLIFEPRVAIKDADAAKAGDQEFKARYLNATGWASAMAEALLEVKDDGNVSTNMDIRNGFAATQTMVGVADAIYRLETILDCLGIELIPKVETVETPYNVQIQIGKGFGEGNGRQIDFNADEATEKLLPSFLRTKMNKIKTVDIHPKSRSIKEILENIEANLPGANNG